VITSNIREAIKFVDEKMVQVDEGTRKARDEMMARLIQLAKEEIKGYRRPGEKAEAGKPPKNRTGNLRRSIAGDPVTIGFAHYYAEVGPQMIYSRRLELGGGNWPSNLKFPYMAPAFAKFQSESLAIIEKHLA